MPEYGNVGNPLDVTGPGRLRHPHACRAPLELLAEAGNLDIVVWARELPVASSTGETPVGQVLGEAVRGIPEVLFLVMALVGGHVFPGASADRPVVDPMDHLDGIPFLQGSDDGLKAIAALIRYAEYQRHRREIGCGAPRSRLVPESVGRAGAGAGRGGRRSVR